MAATYDVEAFREAFESEFTWLNGFLRNTQRFANNPALYDSASQRRWTYAELNGDANMLANALIKDNVRRGDVLMYMLFNSPEFVFCYLAGHKTGAISCPLNFRLSPGEIALQIDDSKPRVFVFGQEFVETARKALALAEHKPERVIIAGGAPNDGETAFEDYIANMPRENPVPASLPHIYDETVRLYTSGTTSKAKAVPINCINEVLSAHDVMMHFPLNSTDRTMNMTPWFHRGGLHSGGLTPTLYAGGEVIALREFKPRRCLDIVAREKVTFLIGVPSILALLARAQEIDHADLSSLRGIVTMGSPFEKSACDRYLKLFTPNIFNGYGTTETFWNTFLRPYQLPEMAGSAGQACTDDDVRIVRAREDGEHGEPDDLVAKNGREIGEIIIKSSAKSTGCYVNNPEMTRKKFYKGYHYTGDLGTWDERNFITVVSRKDDMIISSGENIYPTQIEAIIEEHPGVEECAVVGKPDRLHGQTVTAFIKPADTSLTVADINAWCLNHPMLPDFKRPRIIRFVDQLPHTATGKLMRYKLREQAEGEN